MSTAAETSTVPYRLSRTFVSLAEMLPGVDALYQDLHCQPWLSLQERSPASKVDDGRFEGANIPYAYWGVGAVDHETRSEAAEERIEDKLQSLPIDHSSCFVPSRESTLRPGIQAMAVAILALLK